jgi:two-component system, NarL family, nitrate/nitrite response regulator NarL
MRPSVLVADAHTFFRTGVRAALARESEFEVSEAGTLDEAVEVAARSQPELALIDLHLPPHGGIAAAALLVEHTQTRPIVWSSDPTPEEVLAALRAGASGYLRKEIALPGLVRALRGARAGEAPISRDLTHGMIEALHATSSRDRLRNRAERLSTRECEVLEMIARGSRNRQIAGELAISEYTVKRHVQNILHKLELPSRRAAAAFYRSAFISSESVASVA